MDRPRLAALRYRDFRLLWFGRLLSTTGTQMQLIAVNWHIFDLLRGQSYTVSLLGYSFDLGAEALGLGTVGLVRVVPIILFSLLGGMLADTRDRRQLLIWVQSASVLFSALLAGLTLTGRINVPLIYLLTAGGAAVFALDEPARQSIVPNLVPRRHLANAISLGTLLRFLATVVGPALAGILVSLFDVGIVYAIDALSFGAVIVSLLLMDYRGQATTASAGLGWQPLVEGIRFTFGSRIILSTMLIDFFATFFSDMGPVS
jgi:MFS family permease